jgi:hypothetical protein
MAPTVWPWRPSGGVCGRRTGPIEKLAAELGLPAQIFDLAAHHRLRRRLRKWRSWRIAPGRSTTSAPMIDACLRSRTHYLDITSEIEVFLAAQRRHADAKAAGIAICPGRGVRCDPHRLHRRSAQGGVARRDPPRSGVRRGRTHESRHCAHHGRQFQAKSLAICRIARDGVHSSQASHRVRPLRRLS